jgi:hypothetical protein
MWPLVSHGCGSQLPRADCSTPHDRCEPRGTASAMEARLLRRTTASHKAFIVGGAVALIGTLKPLYKLASRSGLSRVTTRMACTAE